MIWVGSFKSLQTVLAKHRSEFVRRWSVMGRRLVFTTHLDTSVMASAFSGTDSHNLLNPDAWVPDPAVHLTHSTDVRESDCCQLRAKEV